MKFFLFALLIASHLCFGASITLKNSSDGYLTAYLQDSKTAEVFSVPVLAPNGGIAEVDLTGTTGPYTIEWLQLSSPSSLSKTCWGAGTFDASQTSLDSAAFKGKGSCNLSGAGKPMAVPAAENSAAVIPGNKKP